MEVVGALMLTLLMCVALLYAGSGLMQLMVDGRFSREGIDIVMFGGLLITRRLKRTDIRRVAIVSPFKRLGLADLFTRVSIANRLKKRGVAVWMKSGWIWFFTPPDPEAAVAALGIPVQR